MARTLLIPAHLTLDELEQRYRRTKDPVARTQWQILWLLSSGTSTAEVARVTRSSVNWVRAMARRYREDGPPGIGDRRHGNPGATPLLAWPQQEALRAALSGPAPDGGLWTGRWVAVWMSEALGRTVSVQRGWEWMRRLGYTPQRPRRQETRANPEAQEAFKKGGSPPRWPR
jgi:transposase